MIVPVAQAMYPVTVVERGFYVVSGNQGMDINHTFVVAGIIRISPTRLIIMIKMNQEIKKLRMMGQGMIIMVADAERLITLKANKYQG